MACAALLLGAVAGCGDGRPERADRPPVRIDGRFDDWTDARTLFEGADSQGGDGPVRIARLQATDDPDALYLGLDFDRPVNVQGLDGAVLVVLDGDGDEATGALHHGVPGADVVVSLTRLFEREASAGLEARHGIAVWSAAGEPSSRVSVPATARDPYALGLEFEPRHTAARVEIRLRKRASPDGGAAGLPGPTARVALVVADTTGRVTQAVPPASVPLRAGRPSPTADPEGVARAAGTDFRLVVWNISRGRALETPGPVRRILRALAPDLVALDEVSPEADAASVQGLLPSGPDGSPPWNLHLGTSGSGQRGAWASREEVEPAPAFRAVAYPDSVERRLHEPAAADLHEVRRGLEGGGVPATGAWLRVAGRDLLGIAVDLVCCGNSRRSPEDWIRRIEAEAVRRAARAELDASGATPAVLVVGDFNLVGGREPLELAGRGLDPTGADLRDAYALQLDGSTTATWTGGGGPFPPGQLDYVLYSESRLRALRAFVFETGDLDAASLEALGLERADSDAASDHRPIVVDFAWR